MPGFNAHQDQWRRNEALEQHLKAVRERRIAGPHDEARQWECVLAFYRAIHWVEAQLARRRNLQHSTGHTSRLRKVMRGWPAEVSAHKALRDLQELSERVRYRCYIPTDADLQEAETNFAVVQSAIQ